MPQSRPEPRISVVVPTHGRPASLESLLGALGRQTLDPASFEVVAVDDGSTEPVTASKELPFALTRNDAPRPAAPARPHTSRASSR